MTEQFSVLSALLLGLLGSTHCLGMCGGIMGALTMGSSSNKPALILLSYNLGRISSYTLIGAIVGAMGWLATDQLPTTLIALRLIAGSLLICMGLYLANWWFGLTKLELVGQKVWKHIQPFGKKFLPAQHPYQALALGMIWGWLPCGLVYSALALAASQANPLNSALLMFSFGLGTLPALLATGVFAQQFKQLTQNRRFRALNGTIIIFFGIWTAWSAISLLQGHH